MYLIINEPAAALAYSLEKKVGGERTVSNLFIWEVALLMCQSSPLRMELFRSNLQLEIPTWVEKTDNLEVYHFIVDLKSNYEKDISEDKRAVLHL